MNILIVMADQLNGLTVGAAGHPVVQTPNVDALADRGVLFQNAYCNSPLCAPSRFSMMAGQLPSRIAAYDNAAYFPSDVPTFAHYLRAMGYRTCLSGKMHFIGPDQLHGFEERLTTDIYPADFGWTPDWENSGERIDWWYHNSLSVKQAGVAEATNQLDFDDETGFQALRKLGALARDPDPRPFCMVVSFTHPHDPYAARRKYWDMYGAADIDLPATPAMAYEDLDPHSQRLFDAAALDEFEITEDDILNARRAYYANTTYIDEWFGTLVEALERLGMADDTAVLFISDHGDMQGERGLWYKMSFFEHSSRIPMVMSVPGIAGGKRLSTPVSLVDLLPTLVDLGAQGGGTPVEPVDTLDGTSLLPLASGGDGPERVVGEFLGEGAIAPCFMIRRGRYKFIHSAPDPDQLYDLEADPHEHKNLSGDESVAEVEAAFRAEVAEGWDAEALRDTIVADQRRRRLLAAALSEGEYFPWDYQPVTDASSQYMRNHLDLNELEETSRYPQPPRFRT